MSELRPPLSRLYRAMLAGVLLLGLGAGAWVLASPALADFLGDGPVRLLGLTRGARQLVAGLGLMLAVGGPSP